METETYKVNKEAFPNKEKEDLIDRVAEKTGWTREGSESVLKNIAILITSVPSAFLNNEPFTPMNFIKTLALRYLSISLWFSAMKQAEKHGDKINAWLKGKNTTNPIVNSNN